MGVLELAHPQWGDLQLDGYSVDTQWHDLSFIR